METISGDIFGLICSYSRIEDILRLSAVSKRMRGLYRALKIDKIFHIRPAALKAKLNIPAGIKLGVSFAGADKIFRAVSDGYKVKAYNVNKKNNIARLTRVEFVSVVINNDIFSAVPSVVLKYSAGVNCLMFANVREITLIDCHVDCWRGMEKVERARIINVDHVDMSSFISVKAFMISRCSAITGLSNVPRGAKASFHVTRMPNDVEPGHLNLVECRVDIFKEEDIRFFKGAKKCYIKCGKYERICGAALSDVEDLTVEGGGLSGWEHLVKIKKLTLIGINDLTRVPRLPDDIHITIDMCRNLIDLSGLNNKRSVELRNLNAKFSLAGVDYIGTLEMQTFGRLVGLKKVGTLIIGYIHLPAGVMLKDCEVGELIFR